MSLRTYTMCPNTVCVKNFFISIESNETNFKFMNKNYRLQEISLFN